MTTRNWCCANPRGLAARWKYLWQTVFGLRRRRGPLCRPPSTPAETALLIPYLKDVSFQLGPWFILLTYFVIVGASNAVNLTDGLDGLAIMPTVLVAGALAIFVYAAGHVEIANYLLIPHIQGGRRTGRSSAARWSGPGSGFLWFNAYPAQVFMGDVGALALGAALGVVAVAVRQELVLFIMGGVFVLETVSVMLQVLSFKLTGKRIFRMAPAAPSFRAQGLAGAAGHRPLLDRDRGAGPGRARQPEDPLMTRAALRARARRLAIGRPA